MIYLCLGIFFTAFDIIVIKKMKNTTKKKILVVVLSIFALFGLIYGTIKLTNSDNCCECRDCKDCDFCCSCSYPYYYK